MGEILQIQCKECDRFVEYELPDDENDNPNKIDIPFLKQMMQTKTNLKAQDLKDEILLSAKKSIEIWLTCPNDHSNPYTIPG